MRVNEMTKIALLGCGRIGQMHADNLMAHPKVELVGVFDIYTPASQEVADQHGVRVYASPDDVFADHEIDAVLIATATPTHADFIEAAVAADKAVLCEKPIDLNLDRVNICADRIVGCTRPIQLGFNRRFDPGHKAARQAMIDGEIGDLHQVIITSRDPDMPPRAYYESAGGMFRDMTIHDFDIARYMLGEEPTEVFATASRLIDKPMMDELDDYDTAMFVLTTDSGKQCHINNSRTAAYGYDQRIELLGETGMVISDNRTPHGVKRYSNKIAEAALPYEDFFIERYKQSFDAEIDSFVRAVASNEPVEASFEDGRQALRLAEAAYLSLKEKRAVGMAEIA